MTGSTLVIDGGRTIWWKIMNYLKKI
jgi:hypothetical protein